MPISCTIGLSDKASQVACANLCPRVVREQLTDRKSSSGGSHTTLSYNICCSQTYLKLWAGLGSIWCAEQLWVNCCISCEDVSWLYYWVTASVHHTQWIIVYSEVSHSKRACPWYLQSCFINNGDSWVGYRWYSCACGRNNSLIIASMHVCMVATTYQCFIVLYKTPTKGDCSLNTSA